MVIIRWEPFTGVDDAFNRLFSQSGRWNPQEERGGARMEWAPRVNISENDTEYLICAELPALKKQDIQITFEDGMLNVSGERKQHQEAKSEKFHRVESVYGKFSRSFSLPDNVDVATLKAELNDGIVMIHVPKRKAPASKLVEIKIQ